MQKYRLAWEFPLKVPKNFKTTLKKAIIYLCLHNKQLTLYKGNHKYRLGWVSKGNTKHNKVHERWKLFSWVLLFVIW